MDKFRVADMARKYTNYDMIQLHTKLPDYPDSKTRLLLFFLNGGNEGTHSNEMIALVASLVQMGLDTHETIGDRREVTAKCEPFRSVQLKVLAGDYFSSRFYQLLAQEGRIDLIGRLADAICSVNQWKMNLYEKTKMDTLNPEEYTEMMVKINSEIYLTLGAFMQGSYRVNWPDLLREFALCELLAQEISRCRKVEEFFHGLGYWQLYQQTSVSAKGSPGWGTLNQAGLFKLLTEAGVLARLQQLLESQMTGLIEKAKRWAPNNLLGEIQQLLAPYQKMIARPAVPEEI